MTDISNRCCRERNVLQVAIVSSATSAWGQVRGLDRFNHTVLNPCAAVPASETAIAALAGDKVIDM